MHNPNIVVFVEEVEEAKEIDVVDAVVETEVVVVKMIILTYLSLRYKSRRKRQTTALIMSFSPNNDENDESEDSGDNDTGDAFGCKWSKKKPIKSKTCLFNRVSEEVRWRYKWIMIIID